MEQKRMIRKNVERIATDEKMVAKLQEKGFRALHGLQKQRGQESVTPDFSQMNMEELRACAKARGIEGISVLKKDELIAVLKNRNSDGDGE